MTMGTVSFNNRRKVFDVRVGATRHALPFSKVDPAPNASDPVASVVVDADTGRETFTFTMRSGKTGVVHVEQVLEYNKDPHFLRDALLYQLTIEAQSRLAVSPLSRREIMRRLGTSATQLYRLLDQPNYQKSIDQLLALLYVLDCHVDIKVSPAHRPKRVA